MAQWSAAQKHSADALKFEYLSTQIILDQMGLDWIIQMYLIKLWSVLDWIGLDGHINANRIAVKD